MQTSKFNVSYTPRIAGEYAIWVLCGNIVLNGGNPYAMTVLPGLITFLMCLYNQFFYIHFFETFFFAMHEFTTI